MSAPTFYNLLDNAASTLSSAHAIGDNALVVTDASSFGTPSTSSPLRITALRKSDNTRCHYKVVSITGNTLAINSVIDGYSDIALSVGDTISINITAGTFKDIESAVTPLYGDITPTSVTSSGNVTGANLSGNNTGDQTNITGNAATATTITGSISESQVTGLITDLAAKAADNAVVHLSGTETITGVKTFSSTISGSITGNAATVTSNANLTGPVTSVGNETSIGTGVVTNSMLAGSITASKLVQTDIILSESQITNLSSDLSARAIDTAVVHNTGNETIAGTKTFSTAIAGSITGNAANVTGTVAIANGGTGQITQGAAINALLPAQTGNSGKVLSTDGTNPSWSTSTVASAGGASGQFQYNNAGVLGGIATITYDSTNNILNIKGTSSQSSNPVFQVSDSNGVVGILMRTNAVLAANTLTPNDEICFGTSPGGLAIRSDYKVMWSNSSTWWSGGDTSLARSGPAVIAFGNDSTGSGGYSSPPNTPTALAASVNDFSPGPGLFQRWSASIAVNVTGIAAGQAGETRTIVNVGSYAITFTNQDASSAAANRLMTTTGGNVVVNPNQMVFSIYDSVTACWRISLLP